MTWTYRTYRCEWVTEVYGVDQYDQRTRDCITYYEQAWPTKAEADADLERVSKPHPYPSVTRRISDLVNHAYCDAAVRYREVPDYG